MLQTFWEWDAESIKSFAKKAGIPVARHKSEMIRGVVSHVLGMGADTRLAGTTYAVETYVPTTMQTLGGDPRSSVGGVERVLGGLIVRRRERSAVNATCG